MAVNRGPAASTAAKTSSLLRGWQAAAHTVCGTLETFSMAPSSVTRDLRIAHSRAGGALSRGLRLPRPPQRLQKKTLDPDLLERIQGDEKAAGCGLKPPSTLFRSILSHSARERGWTVTLQAPGVTSVAR